MPEELCLRSRAQLTYIPLSLFLSHVSLKIIQRLEYVLGHVVLFVSCVSLVSSFFIRPWGAKYGYGPKQIISETGTLRSETFIFRNILP